MTPRALHAPARLAGIPLLRTQTDERLVDLVRVGNDRAFEAIVARYRRQLLRYCSALLPEGRAEDVVQQTFLRALDALRHSGGEMNLKPWLFRIAHNQALNALRDRSLRHDELSESIDGVERPDQALEKRERLRDTIAAVSALPERQRDALVLRELEGRSYEEIAVALGVSGGAVRQLLSRARITLRAGVTAVTPYGALTRLPAGTADGIGVRVAELCGAGAGGAMLAKACATVLVTGVVIGAATSDPHGSLPDSLASEPATVEQSGAGASATPAAVRERRRRVTEGRDLGIEPRQRRRGQGHGHGRGSSDRRGSDSRPQRDGRERESKVGEDRKGRGDSGSSGEDDPPRPGGAEDEPNSGDPESASGEDGDRGQDSSAPDSRGEAELVSPVEDAIEAQGPGDERGGLSTEQ